MVTKRFKGNDVSFLYTKIVSNGQKEVKLEEAKSIYDKSINDAMAYKETVTAEANAKADQFTQILNAYEQNH